MGLKFQVSTREKGKSRKNLQARFQQAAQVSKQDVDAEWQVRAGGETGE